MKDTQLPVDNEPLSQDERRRLRDALVKAWREDYSVATVVDGLAEAVENIAAERVLRASGAAVQGPCYEVPGANGWCPRHGYGQHGIRTAAEHGED